MHLPSILHRSLQISLLLMLTVSALATSLSAQEPEKKEAAKKEVDLQNVAAPKADAPLPKIDLPEFIITGTERIDLNIEAKSEEDEERIFTPSLPTPGERPLHAGEALTPKQVKSFTRTPGAMNGKVSAGFGFYGTPQFDGWFGQHELQHSFVLNGYYSESNGHLPDAGFWRGGIGVRGTYRLPDSSQLIPNAQLTGEMNYGREAYRAFGSRLPFQVRDLSRYEIAGGIGSRYALPYRSMSGVDYTAKTGLGVTRLNDSLGASEAEFFVSGAATTRILETSFRGSAEYRISSTTIGLPGVKAGHWFTLRADGRQMVTPALQLSYALHQYLYRGNAGSASGRLYPSADLRFAMTEQATVAAGFTPSVERTSLSSLVKQNRYIDNRVLLLPEDHRVHLYFSVEFSPMDELTLTGKASYRHTNNYPTFYDRDSAKVWEVLYLSSIRSSTFDVSALYRLNQRQNVTVYVSTRSVKHADSTYRLPHIPPFSFGAVYHHFFDIGVHAEAFMEYQSSRYTDFANSHRNAGYLASGVKAEVEVGGPFRAFAEANNLLDQQYYLWNGYQERTVFVMLGMSYHW